jgi:hypothetical protein
MAGICSAHQHYEPSCRLCNATPHDLFPDWDEKVAEAVLAGERVCPFCRFEYYKTTDMCPSCGHCWWEAGKSE